MPIYDYHCSRCSRQFEQLVDHRKNKVVCPKCGDRARRQPATRFAVRGDSGLAPMIGNCDENNYSSG